VTRERNSTALASELASLRRIRTALITGASSGIGAATAAQLLSRGFRVLGTSRRPESIQSANPAIEYLELDLTDSRSIERCAAAAGPVDVLINNVGESQSGPLEQLPMDSVERLFHLNVFGPIRLTQLVLPGMRDAGYGRVVMVGSMLATFPLAYRSSYVASKAAIKGFASAARREVSASGVRITTVEPGAVNTGIADRRTHHVATGSVYEQPYRSMVAALDANEKAGISADAVAKVIAAAIETDNPRPVYAVGSNAPLVFTLRRLATRSMLETLVARRHGLR
jgi:short-subunit dehydrogenase